mgnify:CR=1 FL=1
MKNYLLLQYFLLLVTIIQAQGIYNDGAHITTSGSSFLVVSRGNFTVTSRSAENPVTLSNLYIMANASLTVDAQSYLTVNGTLANSSGTDGLILKSNASGTASLMHNTPAVNVTIERYFTGNQVLDGKDFHFVSMPLNATGVAAQFMGMYLYRLDIASQSWVSMGSSTTTQLFNDQGYMVFYPNTNTTTLFVGRMNNGSFTAATPCTQPDQYCLVPNPYPSAIDWDSPGLSKVNLYDAYWIWNPDIGNYSTYGGQVGTFNATGKIPVGQGFLVESNAAAPSLVMTNAARLHDAQEFYKESSEIIPEVLHLKVAANGLADETIVRFSKLATENKGILDAEKIEGAENAPQLYTLTSADEKLTINALPHSDVERIVPLNVEYKQNEQLEITASGLESFSQGTSIFLEDKLTNTMTNLKTTPSYSFMHQKTDNPMRFNLHFLGVNTVNEAASNDSHIWYGANKINIIIPEMTDIESLIEVYDIAGRILLRKTSSMNSPVSVSFGGFTGVVLVRVAAGSRIFSQKLFIR